jgi:hypothetical protein
MITIALTAIAAAYLFASLLILAPKKPGYSHFKNTISEIGEVGAPNQRFVAYGVFLPVGLLLLLVAYLVQSVSTPSAVLALCIAIGYLVAAAFPCDAGSPLSGTARQGMHNLGGAIEYVGGGFALITIAKIYGQPFQAAGFVVLACTLALSILPSTSVRGIIQRIAEICLFAGLALSISRSIGAV